MISATSSPSPAYGAAAATTAILLVAMLSAAPALSSEAWTAIDGDTLLHTIATKRTVSTEKIRLLGVDAPELHARCDAERAAAEDARAFVSVALDQATVIAVEKSTRRDRYGRTLAIVRLDGVSLSAMLLGAGLARPYGGGRRDGWC